MVVRLVVAFLAAVFFVEAFFVVAFLVAVFLAAVAFFVAVFLAAGFLSVAFSAVLVAAPRPRVARFSRPGQLGLGQSLHGPRAVMTSTMGAPHSGQVSVVA